MTLAIAITRLLVYFSPEERSNPDSGTYPGRVATVIGAINGALQEYYGTGKSWKRRETRGAILNAPATVNVTVTHGDTAITFDAWQDWFSGCTIAISGSTIDHTIDSEEDLRVPFDGEDGTYSATVLHDSVDLAADVQSVLKPVRLADGPPLYPVNTPEQLVLGRTRERDYGRHLHIPLIPASIRKSQSTGIPQFYYVDNYHADSYANPVWRLMLSPAPSKAMVVHYRARLSLPVFTDDEDDQEKNLPVPNDHAESIILPIATMRLMAAPFYLHGPHDDEIRRQAALAKTELLALTAQAGPGISMRPGL